MDKFENIIKSTFSKRSKQLPSIEQIKQFIVLDREDKFDDRFDVINNSFYLRTRYIKHSFSILTHDFLVSLKLMIDDLKINNIVELSAGAGWFTHWMRKYDIPVKDCVDNSSWIDRWHKTLPIVKNYDSSLYVSQHKEVDMYILSWPYMDDVAYDIWKSMKPGQYLLYIGESHGGCTGSDEFHENIYKHEIKIPNVDKNFVSFWGVHDRPYLYRK